MRPPAKLLLAATLILHACQRTFTKLDHATPVGQAEFFEGIEPLRGYLSARTNYFGDPVLLDLCGIILSINEKDVVMDSASQRALVDSIGRRAFPCSTFVLPRLPSTETMVTVDTLVIEGRGARMVNRVVRGEYTYREEVHLTGQTVDESVKWRVRRMWIDNVVIGRR